MKLKNKVIIFAVFFFIIFSFFSNVEGKAFTKRAVSPVYFSPTPNLCGDCNGDGVVNIQDAQIAAQHSAGVITLRSPFFEACNVNGVQGGPLTPNANVDVVDALTIAQFSSRKVSSVSCILDNPVIFMSWRTGRPDLFTVEKDGSNLQQITSSNMSSGYFSPSWSPDGTKIIFEYQEASNRDIYVMNADGSNRVRLTTHPSVDNYPAWSPDGSQIAFSSERTGNKEIYVMDSDGGNIQQLTSSVTGRSVHPSWSPDGNQITFSTNRDGNWEIYTFNMFNRTEKRVTTNPSADADPSWSPDGTTIAFVSNRDGNAEIYTIEPSGVNEVRLTFNSSQDGSPYWGRDSQLIFYSSVDFSASVPNADIYSINKNSGVISQITMSMGDDFYPAQ